MGIRLPARCLICPVLLLAFLSGCQAFYRYRPAPILVQDADTKQPIPDVAVRLAYPMAPHAVAPWESSAATGGDGIARLRAAPYGEAGIVVNANARGYMSEEKILSVSLVESLDPPGLFENVEQRKPCYVIEMYAEPRPSVELVVPTGYRGVVKADVEIREELPCPPHQRCFRYTVSAAGTVKVTGPLLLRRVFTPDFHACYADGKPLPRDARDDEVGFWWIKSEGNQHSFLVGTQSELALYRPRPIAPGDDQPSGGKRGVGKRGGGGRRGGGQPPTDASGN